MVAAAVVGSAVVGGVAANSASNRAASASRRAGRAQERAAQEAITVEQEAAQRAQGFFEPFAGAAEQGAAGTSFLTDPQERFDFLQSNPLFQASLENANRRTEQQASAGRRLSFGDTLQQLSNNVLLSAQPLLATQDRNVTNMLQFGGDIASSQANIETGQAASIGNLMTDIGSSVSAGQIAAGQAKGQGFQNMIGLAGGIGGAVSGAPGLISGGQAIGGLFNGS